MAEAKPITQSTETGTGEQIKQPGGNPTPKKDVGPQDTIPSSFDQVPAEQQTAEKDQMTKSKAGLPNEPIDANADMFRQQTTQTEVKQTTTEPTGKEEGTEQPIVFDAVGSTEQAIESVRDNLASIARRGERVDGATLRQMVAQERAAFGVPQEMSAQFTRDVVSGVSGGEDPTKYFSELNSSIEKISNISMMRPSEVNNGITSGNITTEDLEKLKVTDPNKYQAVVDLKNQTEAARAANQNITGEKENPSDYINDTDADTATKDAGVDVSSADTMLGGKSERLSLYKEFVDTEEINGLTGEARGLQDELADLEDQAENLKADIQSEFGTALSKSALNALINDRMEDISREMQTKTDKYNNVLNQINTLKEEGIKQFGIVIQEMQEIEDREWRELEFGLKQRQVEFGMDMDQRQFGFNVDRENWNRNRQQKMLQLDQSEKLWASNRSMMEKYVMSDMNVGQQKELINKISGIEASFGRNLIVGKDQFGNYFASDPVSGTVVERFTVGVGSENEIGETIRSGANSWESVATNAGEYRVGGRAQDGYLSGIGNGIITDIGNAQGFDIDGDVGDAIPAMQDGYITDVNISKTNGNIQMKVENDDGAVVVYNHLDPSTLTNQTGLLGDYNTDLIAALNEIQSNGEKGIRVRGGQTIAHLGNTGWVMGLKDGKYVDLRDKNGKVTSEWAQKKIDKGFGSHVDIGVEVGGKRLSVDEQIKYFSNGGIGDTQFGIQAPEEKQMQVMPIEDLSNYIISKSMTPKDRSGVFKDMSFEDKQAAVMAIDEYTKNGQLSMVLTASFGGSSLSATEKEKLGGALLVVDDVKMLRSKVEEVYVGEDTTFINAIKTAVDQNIRGTVDSAILKQMEESILPQYARNILGEVGALTDTDIERYRRMLPSGANSKQQALAMTDVIMRKVLFAMQEKLKIQAVSGTDVSAYASYMDGLQAEIVRNAAALKENGIVVGSPYTSEENIDPLDEFISNM